ncbi:hypothetical protein AC1031_011074 [Aphanomyces cochlioides]|nr:hypothetical protein AC1031_011074 [Aphanomyces cochlioides]
MKSLYLVGFIFAVVALWGVNLSNNAAVESNNLHPSRTLSEKKAMTLAFLERILEEYPLPGVMLSVVYKNETVIAQGVGTTQFGRDDTPVTAHTFFQIGSFTKTFTALGIAKLIDEGRMQWKDPVKQHLPWFQLQDKNAEKYTTLADLLSMNSVFGNHAGDLPMLVGVWPTERQIVEHLAYYNTSDRSLRAGYAYSNLNFEILGQVIEHVTNMTWFDFVKVSILDPLGMNETFGRTGDASPRRSLSSGHFSCSIVSTAQDMAKLSHFFLRQGSGILKSTKLVQDMTTGHTVIPLNPRLAAMYGLSFNPDGDAMGNGYGFDLVGKLLFGYDFYMKGVAIRSYIMGIFLDIPQDELEAMWNAYVSQFARLKHETTYIFQGKPRKTPGLNIPQSIQTKLVGNYTPIVSPGYYGNATIFQQDSNVILQYGVYSKSLFATEDPSMLLIWDVNYNDGTIAFILSKLNTRQPQLAYNDLTFVRVE